MYVQAGGLTAEPGELDFTTFGSGDAEWSVFGKGYDPLKAEEVADLYYTKHGTMKGFDWAGGQDYVPSLWQSDSSLLDNIGSVIKKGSTLYKEDQAVGNIGNLAAEVYEAKKDKKG